MRRLELKIFLERFRLILILTCFYANLLAGVDVEPPEGVVRGQGHDQLHAALVDRVGRHNLTNGVANL